MRTENGHLCYAIGIGFRGRALMPHSEICIHMQVADKYMDFVVVNGGSEERPNPFVQLYVTEPGVTRFTREFSAPITQGEGGLYDSRGVFDGPLPCYYYPHSLQERQLRDTGKFDELADAEPECVQAHLTGNECAVCHT